MFDARYFNEHLPNHVARLGGAPTVEIHLYGGQTFSIRKVLEATDSFVLVAIYPPEATDSVSTIKALRSRDIAAVSGDDRYDLLSVPYGHISHVVASLKDNEKGVIGFTK